MVFCVEESNKECILYYSTLMMTTLPKTLIQIHLLRPVPGLFKKKHDYNNYMFVYSIQHFLKLTIKVDSPPQLIDVRPIIIIICFRHY